MFLKSQHRMTKHPTEQTTTVDMKEHLTNDQLARFTSLAAESGTTPEGLLVTLAGAIIKDGKGDA
jgi:hypothetical protein